MFAEHLVFAEYSEFVEHLVFAEHLVCPDSGLPALDCGLGMRRTTHHTTARTVRTILAGSAASLNVASTLRWAPFPGTPACPEHVWGAQQMLIAVSVMRKPRGKSKGLVEREATGFPLSGPARDVEPMGMLRVRGVSCSGGHPGKEADVALAMLCVHRQWDARETMRKMLASQCRMDLPVQPIIGETNKNPFKQTPKWGNI